jgi:hypothetical protein
LKANRYTFACPECDFKFDIDADFISKDDLQQLAKCSCGATCAAIVIKLINKNEVPHV